MLLHAHSTVLTYCIQLHAMLQEAQRKEEMRQRWKARWTEGGKPVVFVRDSINNRMVAGIDCRLKANDAGLVVPKIFELEEAGYEEATSPLVGGIPQKRATPAGEFDAGAVARISLHSRRRRT